MLPETNNDTLSFVETGKGKITLVFLHYFGGSYKTWAKVIKELSNDYRCIAIDLPGFGDSQITSATLPLRKVTSRNNQVENNYRSSVNLDNMAFCQLSG